MKPIKDLMNKNLNSESNQQSGSNQTTDSDIRLENEVSKYNNSNGDLKDYDCLVCKNKGYVMIIDDDFTSLQECRCVKKRLSLKLLRQSGLANLSESYTFDKFTTIEDWQKQAKLQAIAFSNDPKGNSFYMGGQVGSGKTHLCTSIVLSLIERGYDSIYCIWHDCVAKLKGYALDYESYSDEISKYKNATVLYIDDFFKLEVGKQPSARDVMIAFDIITYRYINKRDLITIISSEKTINDLLDIDEALGSRVFEMSKNFYIELERDTKKNQRIK